MYSDQQINYNTKKGITPPSEEEIRQLVELPIGRTANGRMDVIGSGGAVSGQEPAGRVRRENSILDIL